MLSLSAHFSLDCLGEVVDVEVWNLELDLVDLLDSVLDQFVGLGLGDLFVEDALLNEVQLLDEAVEVLLVVVAALVRLL